MTLYLTIPGIPKAKQSARHCVRFGHVHSYQKKEVVQNEQNIRAIILSQLPKDFTPFTQGVIVKRLLYIFPPTSNWSKKKIKELEEDVLIFKTTKPDLDSNLNKALFDAMEGIIYLNDSQVCQIQNNSKVYGFTPRIEIELSEVQE